MDKAASNFGDELKSINNEVAVDVGEILKLAKSQSTQKSTSSSTERSGSTEEAPQVIERPKSTLREPKQERVRFQAKEQAASDVRENVTTRLTPKTNELLTEAALRQKLKKRKPDTRQDIIECAVLEWLRSNITSA